MFGCVGRDAPVSRDGLARKGAGRQHDLAQNARRRTDCVRSRLWERAVQVSLMGGRWGRWGRSHVQPDDRCAQCRAIPAAAIGGCGERLRVSPSASAANCRCGDDAAAAPRCPPVCAQERARRLLLEQPRLGASTGSRGFTLCHRRNRPYRALFRRVCVHPAIVSFTTGLLYHRAVLLRLRFSCCIRWKGVSFGRRVELLLHLLSRGKRHSRRDVIFLLSLHVV